MSKREHTLACSVYHSLCGNGAALLSQGGSGSGSTSGLHSAVCAKWLQPVMGARYPRWTGLMLRGDIDAAAKASDIQASVQSKSVGKDQAGGSNGKLFLSIDIPLDGLESEVSHLGGAPVFKLFAPLNTFPALLQLQGGGG